MVLFESPWGEQSFQRANLKAHAQLIYVLVATCLILSVYVSLRYSASFVPTLQNCPVMIPVATVNAPRNLSAQCPRTLDLTWYPFILCFSPCKSKRF